MKVLLLSTYDLGHQPFGLASPAAWLRGVGAEVTCNDLAIEDLNEDALAGAGLICLHLPMHAATRLAGRVVPRIKSLNPHAHLCFFGLYAPLSRGFVALAGGGTIIGGEFESGLVELHDALAAGGEGADIPAISLAKQEFVVPDRQGLPGLANYAYLENGGRHLVGYTEASRGCKHHCLHCPVVPVYGGQFRVVPVDVVLGDIRNQVTEGARHITFGDPDFFNGPGHGMRVAEALHREFPELTFDATIKVEHLIKYRRELDRLAASGCLFVTTAMEAVDDKLLAKLGKGHTRADMIEALRLCRAAGLTLSPTFIPFTPWTTPAGYLDLLAFIVEQGLVDQVAPVQLSMRLLLPEQSLLLELPEVTDLIEGFDAAALSHQWSNPDLDVERLYTKVRDAVERSTAQELDRRDAFAELWRIAQREAGRPIRTLPDLGDIQPVPCLSEPWYCCAEPTSGQFSQI